MRKLQLELMLLFSRKIKTIIVKDITLTQTLIHIHLYFTNLEILFMNLSQIKMKDGIAARVSRAQWNCINIMPFLIPNHKKWLLVK